MITPAQKKECFFLTSALFVLVAADTAHAETRSSLEQLPAILEESIRPADSIDAGVTPLASVPKGHTWIFSVPAPRGLITTRTGQPIAFSKSSQRLVLQLAGMATTADEAVKVTKGIPAFLPEIANLSIPNEDKVRTHFKNRPWIPLPISGELSESEIALMARQKVKGVAMETIYSRVYPHGSLFGHLAGYIGETMPDQHGPLGTDEHIWPPSIGRAGLEKTMEKELVGKPGEISRLFDENGKVTNQEVSQRPRPGLTIVTSLNLRMQKLAAEVVARYRRPAAFVAVDADTGEILAMVSHPSYDPNEFLNGISSERFKEISEDKEAPLFDRAVSGAYPPGSTFKPFVALASLESGIVDGKETRYPGPPAIKIGNREFKNWHRKTEAEMDVRYALLRSCNTWFYQAGMDMGAKPIYDAVDRFALNQAPEIPLEGVSAGMMPRDIGIGDNQAIANFSIGQGDVLTSPLQLALAMAGLANGEFVPKPQLIKQMRDPISNEVVFQNSPQPMRRLYFEQEDLELVRAGMFGVVNHKSGTAPGAWMSRPRVYGKTGTSQWAEDGEERSLAWFSGWVDSESPRIAFAALSQGRPGEMLSGGGNAAPIASGFLKKVYGNPNTYAVNKPSKLLQPDPDLRNAVGSLVVKKTTTPETTTIISQPVKSSKPTWGGLFKKIFGKKN